MRAVVLAPFWIPSTSMQPDLQIDDRVVVDKLAYRFAPVHRGDVVVFDGRGSFSQGEQAARSPLRQLLDAATSVLGLPGSRDDDYVKRVIGLPGDRVTCCDAQGRIDVDGLPLEESHYLYRGDQPSQVAFDVVVPDGRLWVMGDHRSVSADSRAHLGSPGGGMVPLRKVVGRVQAVVWPVSRWRLVQRPEGLGQPRPGAVAVSR